MGLLQGPGPHKVQFVEITGYPEVVGLILAMLSTQCQFCLISVIKHAYERGKGSKKFQTSPIGLGICRPSIFYALPFYTYIFFHHIIPLDQSVVTLDHLKIC